MSRSKGLGSPHMRGTVNRDCRRGTGGTIWLASYSSSFLLIGTIVVFGAVVVGVFVIPEWIVGAITPTLAAGLTGLFFAFLGFGTLIITAAHPDRWYVSPVRLVSYVVIWVLLGLMGVAMLVYAITQPPSGSG
jgi:hypothetical protein